MALALYKAGLPKDSSEVHSTIEAILRRYDPAKGYEPDNDHIYSTSVAAVLLSDADAEQYKPVLDSMAAYLIQTQGTEGGWDYPPPHARNTAGDTSVTHYALLGLWACARAGCEIPGETWERAIQWHIAKQNPDGGFGYTPGFMNGDGMGQSMPNMSINAVGSIAIAWMNIRPDAPPSLEAETPKPKSAAPAAAPPPKNNNALEAVPVAPVEVSTSTPAKIPPGAAESMRRSFHWFAARFMIENKTTSHKSYYYYSLERMAALVNVSSIGGHDWYAECSDFLLANQRADGSWDVGSAYGADLDTTFILLSLVKSTAKLIKRRDPVATFGDGLLTGGRGLPDGQDAAARKANRKATPLDQLLSSLSSATDLDVQDVQDQIIEQVQIGDREALVKQKDLLVRIIQHPNVDVRRTAAWALGRANDLSLARSLINALEDPDVGVNIEAHNALCWISRKPLGFDIEFDPLEGLPLDAGPDVKEAAIKAWRSRALKAWGTWYLKNRPYKDRGDEFEAQLREKLAAMTS